jgi:hypothetical protein
VKQDISRRQWDLQIKVSELELVAVNKTNIVSHSDQDNIDIVVDIVKGLR